MASRFCTKCGTPRTGEFVYCPSCGFKFEQTSAAGPTENRSYSERYAGTPYSGTPAPVVKTGILAGILDRRPGVKDERLRGFLILAGIVVLVLAFLSNGGVLNLGGTGGGGPSAANLPPAGTIWFGSSFDPQTFAIANRLTTLTTNQGFSFVARLPRTMDASQLAIRASLNGQLMTSIAVNAKGSGDTWGFSPGPLFMAGTWKYDLTDIGGNVLATGTITATP